MNTFAPRLRRDTHSSPRGGRALLLALVGLAAVASTVPAWARAGRPPASMRMTAASQASVERLVMAPVDVERLKAEDRIREQGLTPGPARFAAPIEVSYSPADSGTWELLAGGSRLWRLRIASPGALSINLGLRLFDPPAGAELWIYDAAGKRIEGPYTWRHKSDKGELWTPVLLGDEIVLELHMPANTIEPRLEIGAVNHGYRFFGERDLKQGSCNIDVVCPEVDPFRDQVRAVGRYTRSGISLCTGNLVNNTAGDFRPFFLTADHCGINANNAGSVVIYWNYESPVCGDLSGGSLADNQSGTTFLANHFPSDMALVELDQMPDPGSNVFYAGWDAGGAAPQSVVGIHHPGGDEKAAAFEGDPLLDADIGRGGETHWQVTAWDLGTTEGGSSGSCIFDQTTKACVGHLTGGFASCSNPTGFDVYGKFSLAWTGGDTDSTRLSNWLDPVGGGTTFLDGADPDDDGEDGDCTPDSRTMCLDGGRFQVTADWRDVHGNTGPGSVSPLGEDYWGVFWFFSRMNGELLVKVLDGCEYNDYQWVFAAGATNVEYTLTVTDTVTGESRTYDNPQGMAAAPVLDTAAFATCP